jgi:hypothetical protein
MEYVNAYSIQFFKNNFVYKFFNTVIAKIKLINNFVDRDIVSSFFAFAGVLNTTPFLEIFVAMF